MAGDPYTMLEKALEPVFNFIPQRQGRYTYSEVQNLKERFEYYQTNPNNYSFLTLLKAIKVALPYLEKSRIDFDGLRTSLDALASKHQLAQIDWSKLLAHPEVSPKFKFSILNHSPEHDDLLVWITSKSGKPYAQLDHIELTQSLVEHRDRNGFSQKLNDYLKKDPEFLFNLIMRSEKNFIKVSNTRLILYLTDQQIAKAIIHHIPALLNKKKEPHAQVGFLMRKLNEILSNGLSVSTLLRNSEAKAILDNSIFFQIFQSDEYQNREAISTGYSIN